MKTRKPRRRSRRPARRQTRPRLSSVLTLEPLEPRHLLTTFMVNSTADPGTGVCDVAECTFREALTAAEAAGDDEIVFDSSLAGGTISLTSPLKNGANPFGNSTGSGNLTIAGLTDASGAPAITIQGGPADVVGLQWGNSSQLTTANFSMSDMIWTGFDPGESSFVAFFGTVDIQGGDMTIDNVRFLNNTAPPFGNGGGGLSYEATGPGARTAVINNSVFGGNSAPLNDGGGLLINEGSADVTATITNSLFYENDAPNGDGVWARADLNFVNSTIVDNVDTGVVVDQAGNTATFRNSIVSDNGSTNAVASNSATLDTGGTNIITDSVLTFVDRNNDDYHLAASDTAAIDKGTDADATAANLTLDLDGNVRIFDHSTPDGAFGTVDIGAYEFGSSPPVSDTTPPTVTSILRQNPLTSPTNAGSVTFRVTFDEDVQNVDSGDFLLSGSASGDGTIGTPTVVTADSVFDIQITGLTNSNGTINLDIAGGNDVQDLAGNALGGSPTIGSEETYTIDNMAPTVTIGAPSATDTNSGPVSFTITYAGADSVTLAPGDVTLNLTGSANGTVAVTGTGTTTRTVTISSITGDGTLGISLAAGTASDTAGNTAAAAGPSATFNVDNMAPTVTIGAPSVTDTTTGPVTYTVTYGGADAVTLADPNVTLNPSGTANGTVAVSGSGSSTRTVTISGITGDGTLGISIAAGTASDTAGNTAAAAGPSATFNVTNTPSSTGTLADDDPPIFNAPGFTYLASSTNPHGYAGPDGTKDSYYSAANSGNMATWTFTVTPGVYRVSAHWTAYTNRATNAPFSVFDGPASGTPADSTTVNQQQAPDDFEDDGVFWEDLFERVAVSGTTLTVKLSDTPANGFVIADGMRIELITEPEIALADLGNAEADVASGSTVDLGRAIIDSTVTRQLRISNLGGVDLNVSNVSISNTMGSAFSFSPDPNPVGAVAALGSSDFTIGLDTSAEGTYQATLTVTSDDDDEGTFSVELTAEVSRSKIIDNGDFGGFHAPNFTGFGTGYTGSPQGYQGDIHYHAAQTAGAAYANWVFTGLAPGSYQVSVTWNEHANRANNSPFSVVGTTTDGSVAINQRAAPSTFSGAVTDDGADFAPLIIGGNGGNFVLSGSTLTVKVGTSVTGYVIADAVRIALISADEPEIEVLDGDGAVINGGIVLPTVQAGTVVAETITVHNLGSGQLDLGTISISGDTQFSLDTTGTDLTLTGGQSTTFNVLLDTSAADTYNATVSIPSLAPHDDADENPFTFMIEGTVEPASGSAATIIDNGDEGFSSSGGFAGLGAGYVGAPQGYQDDIHYRGPTAPGVGMATWTFDNLDPGTYQVAVTWNAHSNRAEDAPFTLGGTTTNGTVHIDQTQAPGTFAGAISDDGVDWAPLNVGGNGGNFTLSGATLTVTLGTTPQGYVIADAVRIEKLPELRAGRAVAGGQESVAGRRLSPSDVDPVFDAAVAHWSAVDASAAGRLASVTVQVANLPGNVLGLASESQNRIWIDSNAAGYGWRLGQESRDKSQGPEGSIAITPSPLHPLTSSSFSLLTVVTHELGHVLGLPDLNMGLHPHEVMSGRLSAGVSRVSVGSELPRVARVASPPSGSMVDGLFADNDWFDALVTERSWEAADQRLDSSQQLGLAATAVDSRQRDDDFSRIQWDDDDRLVDGGADETDLVDQLFRDLFKEQEF